MSFVTPYEAFARLLKEDRFPDLRACLRAFLRWELGKQFVHVKLRPARNRLKRWDKETDASREDQLAALLKGRAEPEILKAIELWMLHLERKDLAAAVYGG